jgi:hypothetical protein
MSCCDFDTEGLGQFSMERVDKLEHVLWEENACIDQVIPAVLQDKMDASHVRVWQKSPVA